MHLSASSVLIASLWLLIVALVAASDFPTRIRPEDIFRNPLPMAKPAQVLYPTYATTAAAGATTQPSAQPNPVADINAQQHWSSPPQVITVEFSNYSNSHAAAASYQPLRSAAELEQIDDTIAEHVLRFALNVGQQLRQESLSLGSKTEVFSPLSVMSVLALLMLGAKGNSYQQLANLFGIDASALQNNPTLFHTEFSQMLKELQQSSASMRRNSYWRQTEAKNDIRQSTTMHQKQVNHFIKCASGIFAQEEYGLNRNYRDAVKLLYGSQIDLLDFKNNPSQAREHINRWVNLNTYGKIPQIISGELARTTTLVLGSALYFKGFWENSFFEMATTDDKFYPDGLDQKPVKIKMMASGGVYPYYDAAEYNCRIIGLPYVGNETTMYVIQPYESTREKLAAFQQTLDAAKIERMISQMSRKSAVLAFPKMHIVKSTNMKSLLQNLGVNDVFENGLADLSLITAEQRPLFSRKLVQFRPRTTDIANIQRSQREVIYEQQALQQLEAERKQLSNGQRSPLFVEEVFHKVDIDIQEHGTEAAAATLTYLRRSGTDVQFRAETPFMFLIRHDPTKLILFYGIVNEPELV